MSLLPKFCNGQIIDGSFIHITKSCKTHCNSEKCQKFYQGLITNSEEGVFMCPYGLSSVVSLQGGSACVYTGLRIKDYYKKDKAPVKESAVVYNPVLTKETVYSLVDEMVNIDNQIYQLNKKSNDLDDLLHETRKMNAQIKSRCDDFFDTYETVDDCPPEKIERFIKDTLVNSYIAYNRFAYFDTVLNPRLTNVSPFSAGVFKKFDKMRRLFMGDSQKHIRISLNTTQTNTYKYNIYPTFETLLFIIFENAVKYSPPNKSIEVDFSDGIDEILDVSIKSIGPYSDENELLHLCEKGYRGENAKLLDVDGQGYGLSFAKQICDIHKITMDLSSIYSHKDHGVKYGEFCIHLHFDRSNMNVI